MPLLRLDKLAPFQHHQSSAGIFPSNHYDTGTDETEMKLQQCHGTGAKLKKIVRINFVSFRRQRVGIHQSQKTMDLDRIRRWTDMKQFDSL